VPGLKEDLMQTDAAIPWEGPAAADDDEVALVLAAQQDPAAFAPLYRRYRHRVYAYLYTRLTNAEDAADLTQQVFLLALAALPRYRIRAIPFGVWLFRIARNAAADLHRRRPRVALIWETVPEEAQPRAAHDVEAEVVQREALAHLHATLRTLDPDTRDLLMLRFAARLTAAEIGAVTGKSTAAASKRLQRALQTLKEHYHESSH
jgi:RNA polymerase sigma-70 factor (ECF subfamily)